MTEIYRLTTVPPIRGEKKVRGNTATSSMLAHLGQIFFVGTKNNQINFFL
jgi:hypothetical protein